MEYAPAISSGRPGAPVRRLGAGCRQSVADVEAGDGNRWKVIEPSVGDGLAACVHHRGVEAALVGGENEVQLGVLGDREGTRRHIQLRPNLRWPRRLEDLIWGTDYAEREALTGVRQYVEVPSSVDPGPSDHMPVLVQTNGQGHLRVVGEANGARSEHRL